MMNPSLLKTVAADTCHAQSETYHHIQPPRGDPSCDLHIASSRDVHSTSQLNTKVVALPLSTCPQPHSYLRVEPYCDGVVSVHACMCQRPR